VAAPLAVTQKPVATTASASQFTPDTIPHFFVLILSRSIIYTTADVSLVVGGAVAACVAFKQ